METGYVAPAVFGELQNEMSANGVQWAQLNAKILPGETTYQ